MERITNFLLPVEKSDPPTPPRRSLNMIDHIQAKTYHRRRGAIRNAFDYSVDFVVSDLTAPPLWLLSHNGFNLWTLSDRHHGGPRGDGKGMTWFREVLTRQGFAVEQGELLLITQPSFLGLHFNPVSFWVALIDGEVRAFVAEVNNTFGHRHCYFCAHDDFSPISFDQTIKARKSMHVSPFQQIAGSYSFNFGLTQDQLNIRIHFENGDQGVLATLTGPRRPASDRALLGAALRRPFGAARVVGLIYWQALKLYLKRAPFLRTPPPPSVPMTHSSPLEGDDSHVIGG